MCAEQCYAYDPVLLGNEKDTLKELGVTLISINEARTWIIFHIQLQACNTIAICWYRCHFLDLHLMPHRNVSGWRKSLRSSICHTVERPCITTYYGETGVLKILNALPSLAIALAPLWKGTCSLTIVTKLWYLRDLSVFCTFWDCTAYYYYIIIICCDASS